MGLVDLSSEATSATYQLSDTDARPPSWRMALGSHSGPHSQKGPALGLMLCYHHLEILNNFGTRDPGLAFSFCTRSGQLCSRCDIDRIHQPSTLGF